MINDWLIQNLGLTFAQLSVILGFLASISLNIYQARDRISAKTIALNNATIKNLEIALAETRQEKTKHDAEKDAVEKKVCAKDLEISLLNGEKLALNAEVSGLVAHIENTPQLVWWNNVYKEALPRHTDKPRWFCAECWDKRRVYSELQTGKSVGHSRGKCIKPECKNYNVYQ